MMIFLFIIVPHILSSQPMEKIIMVEKAIYHKRKVAKVFLFFPLFGVGGSKKICWERERNSTSEGFFFHPLMIPLCFRINYVTLPPKKKC